MVLIYITCRDKKEARIIALHLLKRRLIACANFFPIESMFHWKGKIVHQTEHLLFAKTLKKHYGKIKKEVSLIHSYSLPCIAMIAMNTNKSYDSWVKEEVIK